MPLETTGLNAIYEDLLSTPDEAASYAAFEQFARLVFQDTQDRVHVVTGNLKRSGRFEITREAGALVLTIRYGDGLDYATEELYRGGTHDFFAGLPLLFETGMELLKAAA